MQYLLATYVDGAYWRSALEILLYPTGCSFYRPFSYRKAWAGREVVATPVQGPLAQGVIGLRFRDREGQDTRKLFIPLRRIEAICIRGQDEFHVNFRLGEYIHHTEKVQFTAFDLSSELADEFRRNEDILLTTLPGQFASDLTKLPTKRELPPDTWDRFIDDPNLAKKASGQLGNVVLLQLVRVRQRSTGMEIAPTELETLPAGSHTRSGYKLFVGQVYDLELIHKTLTAPGASRALQSIAYECTAPAERVRISRTTIPQTGNYREEQVWVQSRRVEPAPTLLDWEPRDETQPVAAGQRPEGAVSLRIPFLATALPWYKFRTGRLWTGLAFTLLAALFFGLAVISAKASGTEWPAVWVSLGAVCAPIGANALSRWWDEWQALEE